MFLQMVLVVGRTIDPQNRLCLYRMTILKVPLRWMCWLQIAMSHLAGDALLPWFIALNASLPCLLNLYYSLGDWERHGRVNARAAVQQLHTQV